MVFPELNFQHFLCSPTLSLHVFYGLVVMSVARRRVKSQIPSAHSAAIHMIQFTPLVHDIQEAS